jgi:copper(I)-binding protein
MKIPLAIPAALAALALAGCHHHHHTTRTVTSPGIVISQARLVLPAVKGNPAAAYFTLANESHAPATLVGVDITGARKTEMHETSGGTMQPLSQVLIYPGRQVIFAPGGRHVMVFDLVPTLTTGGTSEITLHFQDGKTASAPLRIDSVGSESAGDMAPMAGMAMSGKPR